MRIRSSIYGTVQVRDISGYETGQVYAACSETCRETGGKGPVAEEDESEKTSEELFKQIENLEKRVERLEHHSFVQQEDVT